MRGPRVAEDTDWERITALYDGLARISPSPVVELNRGVATAQAFGPEAGLDIVLPLFEVPSMRDYHLLPAVAGDLLCRIGEHDQAREHFLRAAAMTRNERRADDDAAPRRCMCGRTPDGRRERTYIDVVTEPRTISRRSVLLGTLGAAVSVALAACGSEDTETPDDGATPGAGRAAAVTEGAFDSRFRQAHVGWGVAVPKGVADGLPAGAGVPARTRWRPSGAVRLPAPRP